MKFFMAHKASPDRAVRRRIIILSLLRIAAIVTYLAVSHSAIAMNLILLFGGIIGSYVFGAVWDSSEN